MLNFLRLIRLPNLLMVALTQYVMRWLVIFPILDNFPIKVGYIYHVYQLEMQLSEQNFFFLVLATLFLTAGGYVINDYIDRKSDMVNKPQRVVVGKYIKRRTAMALHVIFNIIGIGLGFYVSWQIGLYQLGFIFVIITGILWYYSTSYKNQFLIGNLLVALLTALVPLMVVLYEIPPLHETYGSIMLRYHFNFSSLFYWVGGFSFFAFITTLIREIIKDMEDFEGDSAYGANTMPIVAGLRTTKGIVVGLIVLTLAALAVVYFLALNDPYSLFYMLLGLFLPFGFVIYKILRAQNPKDYHLASSLTKLIMLVGLGYSGIVYYMLNYAM